MQKYQVMIVDDEEWIVKGLSNIIDWEQEGFHISGTFTDSMKALTAIREKDPDLLLLDIRMPKISGEMFMEIIHEEGISCEFIILSGYSDFSIAQKAIQYDAVDYLLKPFDKAHLLKAIRKAYKILETQQKTIQDVPIDPMNENAFLSRAFSSEDWNRQRSSRYYQLVQANTNNILTLPQISNTFISRPVTIYGGHLLWLMVSDTNNPPATPEQLSPWAQENGFDLGLSKTCLTPLEYHNLYRQTNCALCNTILAETYNCYSYQAPDTEKAALWQEYLEQAYHSKNIDTINFHINNLVDQWRLGKNPASISLLLSQLAHKLIQNDGLLRLKDGELEKFLFDDINSQFSSMNKIVEFLQLLLFPSPTDSSKSFTFSPQIIIDVKAYLHERFHEDLNLNQLAGQFFLSPTYLSSLFKQFTGYTITSYLLKIRMEQASELLLQKSIPLVEISESISYNDYNYFCRLFKRYYGVSPTSYQKNHTV